MKQRSPEQILADIEAKKLKLDDDTQQFASMASEFRMRYIHETGQIAVKRDPYTNKDIYIVLVPTNQRTKEMLPMDNVFIRLSCPTPGYNQNVFKYYAATGTAEFLWSIPRKAIYWHLYKNKNYYLQNHKTKARTAFVIMMENGDLLKWAKKENKELPDAVISVNKPAIIEG
jgi:hypothetical protein